MISAIHSCYKLWDKIDPCFFCKKISAKFSSKSLTECLWREYIKDYEKLECSHRKPSNQIYRPLLGLEHKLCSFFTHLLRNRYQTTTYLYSENIFGVSTYIQVLRKLICVLKVHRLRLLVRPILLDYVFFLVFYQWNASTSPSDSVLKFRPVLSSPFLKCTGLPNWKPVVDRTEARFGIIRIGSVQHFQENLIQISTR